jgi:hypothetical protein
MSWRRRGLIFRLQFVVGKLSNSPVDRSTLIGDIILAGGIWLADQFVILSIDALQQF